MEMRSAIKNKGYRFSFLDLGKSKMVGEKTFIVNGKTYEINEEFDTLVRVEYTYNFIVTVRDSKKTVYMLDNSSKDCPKPVKIRVK